MSRPASITFFQKVACSLIVLLILKKLVLELERLWVR